jgi:adenine-specific DNA methylase
MSQRKTCDIEHWKKRARFTHLIQRKYARLEKHAGEESLRSKALAEHAKSLSQAAESASQEASAKYLMQVNVSNTPASDLSGDTLFQRALYCEKLLEDSLRAKENSAQQGQNALAAEAAALSARQRWLIVLRKRDAALEANSEQHRRREIAGELISELDMDDETSLNSIVPNQSIRD